MYSKFFGFKENPFMLAPNPAYLFLGKSHEEALAHLIYAVSEGEGFICLIGKRGVGKTTVCQAFIDRRNENTEVAYIFKPEVSPEELLKTIMAEYGISADSDDSKDIIDRLNSYLMQKRVEGKKVLLFIDDAQNLNADVLEQVRLLSNLETTREKLLQIVLVGEPELADMLGSRALRQIGQRVSVSYYITALTYEETCAYIHHRMSIASRGTQTHFASSALKRIYNFSGGIPRLINIACDKALFTAHRLNQGHITGDIIRTALLGIAAGTDRRRPGFLSKRRALAAAGSKKRVLEHKNHCNHVGGRRALAGFPAHQLDQDVTDKPEPDAFGNGKRQRHRDSRDDCRRTFGDIRPVDVGKAARHQAGDKQQGRRGRIRRHTLCQRREEQATEE